MLGKKVALNIICLISLCSSELVFAQARKVKVQPGRNAGKPAMTYDLRASSGTQNNKTFNEVHLGLNWNLNDFMTWRNALFTRFGSEVKSVQGLDSSLLFSWTMGNEDRSSGLHLYAGPGVRLASEKYSAGTLDGGFVVRLAGLQLGAGAKHLTYFETRKDAENLTLPKNETQVYITLSGGGAF